MKKVLRLGFTLIMLLTLTVSSVAYAQDEGPNAPQIISTWTLSPNPSPLNGDLTTDIAFSFTSVDATTQFCIEGPANAGSSDANWFGTMPASISLNLTQGFTSEPVSFSRAASELVSAATCPGGTRVALYTGTHTAALTSGSNIDVTTSTGSTIDLNAGVNVATVGTANWTLYLGEATGAPGSLGYSLELEAVETPDTGLSGRLIDSKDSQPWKYGAEIKVVQTSGANTGLKGSAVAAADGTWSITFGSGGTDTLGLCGGGCTAGNEYATYQIIVNFTCDLSNGDPYPGSLPDTHDGTRPAYNQTNDSNCPIDVAKASLTGLPTNFEKSVTDSASGGAVAVGDMETGRGPTAITLADQTATTSSASPWLPVVLVVGALAVVSGGLVMVRRKRS